MDNYNKSEDIGHLLFLELFEIVLKYTVNGTEWDKIVQGVQGLANNVLETK